MDKNPIKAQQGFTLVEVLISLAISLVILFGILNLFDRSQETYVVQEEVAELQQNVRIAKMFVERDVRMAGSGTASFSFGGEVVYPIEFENNVDGTTGTAATLTDVVVGTDVLVIHYQNFNAEGCGVDPGGNPACDSMPQLILTADMPDTSAVAIVVDDLTTAPYSAWDSSCYCNGVTYTQPAPGMPFIISTPDGSQSAVLFQTSTLPLSNKIGNSPYNGYPNKVLNTFPAGSTINFFYADGLYEAVYYISTVDGIPCLVREANGGAQQVIAEYIEDLQCAFGLDTTADGSVDAWVTNSDLTTTQMPQVRLVRMNLLGRSAHGHKGFNGQRPATEDHAAGGTDTFRRRQLTVTVKVRNLGL